MEATFIAAGSQPAEAHAHVNGQRLHGMAASINCNRLELVINRLELMINRIELKANRSMAFQKNFSLIKRNRRAFAEPGRRRPVFALNKGNEGFLELPAALTADLPASLRGDPPAPGPGVLPPPDVTFLQHSDSTLSKQQIAALARFYNNNFSIDFEADELSSVQNQRLKDFLTGN
ncbi:hypothetical protein HDU96_010783 [Phlyctochytrium bullatum]|nr:hypothetical protein HDU96_010783 [Phlyctochytrium bullatum]